YVYIPVIYMALIHIQAFYFPTVLWIIHRLDRFLWITGLSYFYSCPFLSLCISRQMQSLQEARHSQVQQPLPLENLPLQTNQYELAVFSYPSSFSFPIVIYAFICSHL